jgi:phosphoglycolate phosphatase
MKYKAVLFDLDGTILNTLNDLANAVNYALEAHGYPVHSVDKIRTFIGNGIDILIRRALPEGATEEEWLKTRDSFKTYYNAHLCDYTAPYTGINELLCKLKAQGFKTAVCTNKNHDMANELVPRFFDDLFDVIIGTDLSKRERKPAPDCVFTALDVLNEKSENAIYIGDTEVDVQTAHNSGIECVGVMWGFRCNSAIDGADYVVNTPEDILELVCK